MRFKLFVKLSACFFLLSSYGQTYTDVAASQNVSFVQSMPQTYASGMSFYDFDKDGWDDLTFPTNSDFILMYRNVNGTFQQIESFIVSMGSVRQIVWVDYDNDEDLDVCISYHDMGIQLQENDGNFNFTDVTASTGLTTQPFQAYGFAFADPDADGDLDMYVASHEIPGIFLAPMHNLYYENQGNGTFVEKAQSLGIDNGYQPTFMPAWFDYDNDDDLDLAIINDKEYWTDAFYHNSAGVYEDTASFLGFENNGHNPMSLSVADYNNDGFQDVFKTDVGSDVSINGVPLDHKLYRNNFGTGFTEVAQGSGLDTNIFSWGSLWVDYDNDCFEDLVIATALGSGTESLLFKNNAGSSFTLMNDSINGNLVHTAYSPIKGDIDNNGFYDVVILNEMADPNVLLNSGNGNHYIKLDLIGNYSNAQAIGSKIEVFANGQHQTQTVFCGSGLCVQNSQHKIFGLGTSLVADSVVVTFPSGIIMKEYNLPADSNYIIHEQVTEFVDLNQGVDTVYACPGDQFVIGMEGYINYEWSNGSIDSLVTVQSSGWYSYNATNQAMDTLFVSNVIYYDFEYPMSVVESLTDPGCGQGSDGAIDLILTPIQFVSSVDWSNGNTGPNISGLTAGTYSYTVTTNHACVYTGSIVLQNTPVFTTQVLTEPFSDTDMGSANFFMWGGVAPYTFVLDGNPVSNPVTNLNPGNYDIYITDANGCTDTVNFVIANTSTASLNSLDSSSVFAVVENGQIFISSPLMDEIQSIELFDMMGAKVMGATSWDFDASSHSSFHRVDSLAKGIYRVVLTFENFRTSLSVSIH